jgi:tryptophanyl-tRNA synthetase
MSDNSREKVIVSGMRPTGYLHLGHYHGVIENWTKLQEDSSFAARFFFVADWHSLTTGYDNTAQLKDFSHEIIVDWLAFGLDPKQCTLFIQSQVPEHAELQLLLGMITPIAWLERVPSFKDLQNELKGKDLSTFGFLGYPLLQTADVAMYHGTHVPVGQDQVAHIELSREIVRRFNHIYKQDILAEPQSLLNNVPKLLGTDGRKMSKSYNNSIYLKDDTENTRKKMMGMVTDPARVKRTDAGDPEKCPVFDFHNIYSSDAEQQEVTKGCTTAGIGCVDCKKILLKNMDARLTPLREKRAELEKDKGYVQDVISTGNAHAQQKAKENMRQIREAVRI